MLVVAIKTTDTPHLSSSRKMMEMGKESARLKDDGGLSTDRGSYGAMPARSDSLTRGLYFLASLAACQQYIHHSDHNQPGRPQQYPLVLD